MESAFCLISALWPHRGFILSILFFLIFGFPDVILECSHRGVTHGFFSCDYMAQLPGYDWPRDTDCFLGDPGVTIVYPALY